MTQQNVSVRLITRDNDNEDNNDNVATLSPILLIVLLLVEVTYIFLCVIPLCGFAQLCICLCVMYQVMSYTFLSMFICKCRRMITDPLI